LLPVKLIVEDAVLEGALFSICSVFEDCVDLVYCSLVEKLEVDFKFFLRFNDLDKFLRLSLSSD